MLLNIANFKKDWPFTDGKWDRKIVNHPNTTGPVLDVLIHRGLLDIDVFGVRLAKDDRISEASIRILLGENSNIRLFTPIRKALAANHSTPIAVIEQLAIDKDEGVSKAAKRALKSRASKKQG
jgi:hypothetical protein